MQERKETLRFALGGNAKLPPLTASFSLPSGYSCPGAKICLAKADRVTGKITDGKDAQFRCFQTSLEAAFAQLRKRNWINFDQLRAARTTKNMRELILDSLPARHLWKEMRIHVGGDFYNLSYFKAWVEVAAAIPDKLFYAYTTSGHLFKPFKVGGGVLPDNFQLTGSMGGKYEEDYKELTASTSRVVMHPEDTELPIDHDESHARKADGAFALLIHGAQPTGSDSAAATKRLRSEGVPYTYSSKKTATSI